MPTYTHTGRCKHVYTLPFPSNQTITEYDTRQMYLQTAGDPNKWIDEHGWQWAQSNGDSMSGKSGWKLELNTIQPI